MTRGLDPEENLREFLLFMLASALLVFQGERLDGEGALVTAQHFITLWEKTIGPLGDKHG